MEPHHCMSGSRLHHDSLECTTACHHLKPRSSTASHHSRSGSSLEENKSKGRSGSGIGRIFSLSLSQAIANSNRTPHGELLKSGSSSSPLNVVVQTDTITNLRVGENSKFVLAIDDTGSHSQKEVFPRKTPVTDLHSSVLLPPPSSDGSGKSVNILSCKEIANSVHDAESRSPQGESHINEHLAGQIYQSKGISKKNKNKSREKRERKSSLPEGTGKGEKRQSSTSSAHSDIRKVSTHVTKSKGMQASQESNTTLTLRADSQTGQKVSCHLPHEPGSLIFQKECFQVLQKGASKSDQKSVSQLSQRADYHGHHAGSQPSGHKPEPIGLKSSIKMDQRSPKMQTARKDKLLALKSVTGRGDDDWNSDLLEVFPGLQVSDNIDSIQMSNINSVIASALTHADGDCFRSKVLLETSIDTGLKASSKPDIADSTSRSFARSVDNMHNTRFQAKRKLWRPNRLKESSQVQFQKEGSGICVTVEADNPTALLSSKLLSPGDFYGFATGNLPEKPLSSTCHSSVWPPSLSLTGKTDVELSRQTANVTSCHKENNAKHIEPKAVGEWHEDALVHRPLHLKSIASSVCHSFSSQTSSSVPTLLSSLVPKTSSVYEEDWEQELMQISESHIPQSEGVTMCDGHGDDQDQILKCSVEHNIEEVPSVSGPGTVFCQSQDLQDASEQTAVKYTWVGDKNESWRNTCVKIKDQGTHADDCLVENVIIAEWTAQDDSHCELELQTIVPSLCNSEPSVCVVDLPDEDAAVSVISRSVGVNTSLPPTSAVHGPAIRGGGSAGTRVNTENVDGVKVQLGQQCKGRGKTYVRASPLHQKPPVGVGSLNLESSGNSKQVYRPSGCCGDMKAENSFVPMEENVKNGGHPQIDSFVDSQRMNDGEIDRLGSDGEPSSCDWFCQSQGTSYDLWSENEHVRQHGLHYESDSSSIGSIASEDSECRILILSQSECENSVEQMCRQGAAREQGMQLNPEGYPYQLSTDPAHTSSDFHKVYADYGSTSHHHTFSPDSNPPIPQYIPSHFGPWYSWFPYPIPWYGYSFQGQQAFRTEEERSCPGNCDSCLGHQSIGCQKDCKLGPQSSPHWSPCFCLGNRCGLRDHLAPSFLSHSVPSEGSVQSVLDLASGEAPDVRFEVIVRMNSSDTRDQAAGIMPERKVPDDVVVEQKDSSECQSGPTMGIHHLDVVDNRYKQTCSAMPNVKHDACIGQAHVLSSESGGGDCPATRMERTKLEKAESLPSPFQSEPWMFLQPPSPPPPPPPLPPPPPPGFQGLCRPLHFYFRGQRPAFPIVCGSEMDPRCRSNDHCYDGPSPASFRQPLYPGYHSYPGYPRYPRFPGPFSMPPVASSYPSHHMWHDGDYKNRRSGSGSLLTPDMSSRLSELDSLDRQREYDASCSDLDEVHSQDLVGKDMQNISEGATCLAVQFDGKSWDSSFDDFDSNRVDNAGSHINQTGNNSRVDSSSKGICSLGTNNLDVDSINSQPDFPRELVLTIHDSARNQGQDDASKNERCVAPAKRNRTGLTDFISHREIPNAGRPKQRLSYPEDKEAKAGTISPQYRFGRKAVPTFRTFNSGTHLQDTLATSSPKVPVERKCWEDQALMTSVSNLNKDEYSPYSASTTSGLGNRVLSYAMAAAKNCAARQPLLPTPKSLTQSSEDFAPCKKEETCKTFFCNARGRSDTNLVSTGGGVSAYVSRLLADSRVMGWTRWGVRAYKAFYSNYKTTYVDTHCHLDFLFNREPYTGTFAEYREKNKKTFPDNFEGCVAVFCNPRTFTADCENMHQGRVV